MKRQNLKQAVFALGLLSAFLSPHTRAQGYHDAIHEPKLFAQPEAMEALLRGWVEQKPDQARVEVIGRSWWSRPPIKPDTPTTDILALHVTDTSVPAGEKQVVVIAGMRVVFSTTPGNILYTARWLLGDDPLAVETRRRQHVIFIPSTRPFYAIIGGNVPETLYDHWSWEGAQDPETNIESAAIQRLLDEWQPEVFVDVSGRVVHREAMVMEAVGLRERSALSSCYVPEIPVRLAEAAAAGGYQVHYMHPYMGHGLVPSMVPMEGARPYYYLQSWKVLPTDYAYRHYHTIGLPVSASFRESLLLMMQELFSIGNTVWKGERHAGYPVNNVGGSGPVILTAWGETAAQRRSSRTALWQEKSRLGVSYFNDPHPNALVAVLVTDPSRTAELFAPGPRSGASTAIAAFDLFENIERSDEADRFDLDPVRGVLARHWRGSRYAFRPQGMRSSPAPAFEEGLVLRGLFPYLAAEIDEVRLDGRRLEPSPTDGYSVIRGPGTIVEAAIPPGEVKAFHVFSVEVIPDRPFEVQDEALFTELP